MERRNDPRLDVSLHDQFTPEFNSRKIRFFISYLKSLGSFHLISYTESRFRFSSRGRGIRSLFGDIKVSFSSQDTSEGQVDTVQVPDEDFPSSLTLRLSCRMEG